MINDIIYKEWTNVDDGSGGIEHDVAVVPVLDLEKVTEDAVSSHALYEISP